MIQRDRDTSFDERVRRHRVLQARVLLITSPDQSIPEIARAVGFASVRSFSSAFRRHTGTTPRRFRAAGAAW